MRSPPRRARLAICNGTYCQSGIRAAFGQFVLALLGNERVRTYDGSMGEWANRQDTPLVVPTR